ncbi:Ig-like domain-containing protein [uncultured Massilia sp.]|uniref:Ig-like domain-containing protein n=1 Tax=uncultured Massilia sp. TaxID=169973 RepID=UPI0025E8750D|nr:Ig-like domain-containing protein [uncultured Massilia sp.]
MTTIPTPTTAGASAAFIFIDSRVPDWQALVDALPPGSTWRLIDAGADGLAQVAQALAGQHGVGAVHILSHGAAGSVQLGDAVLTAATLGAHAADLAAIGAALGPDGDILLYGCDAGAGSAGAALVETMARLTGADVAASTDMTGAAALGGNWVLERSSGQIEAQALGAGLAGWNDTLATSANFDFTAQVTGATQLTVPGDPGVSSRSVTQQVGSDFLTLEVDAGRVVAVDESEVLGNDAQMHGRMFVVDAIGTSVPMPKTITLTLDGGKRFDLDAFSVVDLAGYQGTLTVRTDQGSFQVNIDTVNVGQRVDLSFEPKAKGVTWVELSDPDGDPLMLGLDDIAMSNIHSSTPPEFDAPSGYYGTTQNAPAGSLADQFLVNDPDVGETLTWTVIGEPEHGDYTLAGATAAAGAGYPVKPGTLTYRPDPGYAGTDSITVQVYDGTTFIAKTITIYVDPVQPGKPVLDAGSDTGTSQTDGITAADGLKLGGTSGVGDSTSKVRVFIDQNGNGSYNAGENYVEAIVRADGTWVVENLSTVGLNGVYDVYAYVTSAIGAQSSSLSAPLRIEIDHTPPSTTFAAFALSNVPATGAADFTTNVAAQTISATLSAALQAGDRVQGSVDNGAHWDDITAMVQGTALTWTGATLVAGGTILLRVLDQHGNAGDATARAYTLDLTAPVAGVAFAAFSGDGDGNHVVNDPWQIVAGRLTQSLGADEFVEVSLNDGNSWTTAFVNGTDWTLDITELAGSGTLVARVADKAGNHGTEFRQAYVLDQVAPTASVAASAQLAAPGGDSFTVVVTYADAGSGIDASRFGTGNIGVTAPGGASLQVTGFVANGNEVTYTVQAPGGSWDPLDAGTYTVAIKANGVRDGAGNAVAANGAAGTIDVLFSTAPDVGGLALSADTGSSDTDFLTRVAAQTIHATLSKPLAAGDVVEGSLDNGGSWTILNASVDGTTLAWDVALSGSGTILLRVTDGNGLPGTAASHAYTLDTSAPTQAITDVAFSVDSGAAGDFVTNVAAQALGGKLGAPLGAGEFVEVSIDGGAHWTEASASGSDWSLAGITLAGSGTLQVRVADAAGNQGTPWQHAYLLDTTAPTAGTPVRADLLDPAGASFTLTVTYDDDGAGIDPATVGTDNISVGGLAVIGAVLAGNTVTYTVAAPGGGWDPLDAGSYTIAINASVKDLAGNTVAANAAAHAFDVAFTPAPGVAGLALSADTGGSDTDFLTRVAAQTVHATLSKPLAAGDVVEGSLDNGGSWTVITDKVAGTTVAWDGVTLSGSGTIVIKVTGANGIVGTTASHAYTLDTAAPAQAITDVAFSVDSGADGDFVTNVAAQALGGKLGAPLGAGEFVEVSIDGGAHWTEASASGSDWSLAGITLSGSGTLQVRVADAAGNQGTPWQHAYLLDTTAPTAGTPVRADLLDPAGASFTFTVTYADGGAGIDPATIGTGNVGVTGPGGALAVIGAAAAGNTVTYTVAAPGGGWDPLDAGSYTIAINASVKDLAGNTVAANAAAHAFTVGVNSAPVLAGTFATPRIADDASATPFAGVTVADADGDSVTLTIGYPAANGTLSGAGLAGAAGSYTLSGSAAEVQAALRALVFVPTANQVATGTVATVFTLAASDGSASASNDATVVTTAPVAPTATIALSDTALAAGETAVLTVTFSEAVTGLGAGALTLPGGTLGTLASSDGGRTWSATFTPGADLVQGPQQVVLDLGGVRDAGGLAGSGTASGPAYTVNTVRPTATVAIDDTVLTAGDKAKVTIVFSEAVSGFTTADLALANGTLSDLASLDGITWTATLTPAANVFAGASTVRLDLAGVRNAAGNAGSGTVQSNPYTVDTLPPDDGPGNGTVDGIPVLTGTLVDPLTGLVNNTLAVPTVPATHEGLANIPLAASANGVTSTLTIGLPGGAGLQASGPASLLDNAMAQQDLANRIGSNTASDADGRAMAQHGADFLRALGPDVLVHTLTIAPELTGAALARVAAAAAPARPDIAITGGTDAGASVALALVIDAGGLPAGTTLQLNDVQLAAVAGAVTLRGGAGDNFVTGDGASQNILLGEGDDTLYGGGGDDVIGSTGGNDSLYGDDGNDTLAGGIGNDDLHGGAGNDVLQGGRSATGDWQFVLGAGVLQAVHQTATFAPDAHETLAATALDGSAAELAFLAAGQGALTDIALLYQAAFGRAPDVGGLNDFLAHGVGAADLARAFAASAEWSAAGLGTLSDADFVQRLYGDVLDRAGDSAGMAFWTGKLGEGAVSRADVLLALALSDEHRGHYADGIVVAATTVERENGWIAGSGDDRLEGGAGSDLLVGGDGVDTVVYAGRLADYRLVLGADGMVRVADKANADVDTLSGIELGEFSDGTVDLAFTEVGTATLTTLGLLYQAVLDRTGDAGGFGWWSGLYLDAGALVAAFTGSAEFAARYGSLSDADFVATLYANSGLDANAAGGSAAWVAMLHEHTRAELVGSWIAQDAVQQAQFGTQGLWLV